jgi:hypothetical protein
LDVGIPESVRNRKSAPLPAKFSSNFGPVQESVKDALPRKATRAQLISRFSTYRPLIPITLEEFEPRPSEFRTSGPRDSNSGSRALCEPYPLLFSNDSENADDGIAEDAAGVQILLGEALIYAIMYFS